MIEADRARPKQASLEQASLEQASLEQNWATILQSEWAALAVDREVQEGLQRAAALLARHALALAKAAPPEAAPTKTTPAKAADDPPGPARPDAPPGAAAPDAAPDAARPQPATELAAAPPAPPGHATRLG